MADKKVIAVTVVHRTLAAGVPGDKSKGISAKPPKVQVIQPKTVFLVSNSDREGFELSEYEELKALGAIRDPDKDEKVEVSVENVVADETVDGKTTKTTKTSTKAPAKTPAAKATTGTKAGENTGDNTGSGDNGDNGAGDAGNDLV